MIIRNNELNDETLNQIKEYILFHSYDTQLININGINGRLWDDDPELNEILLATEQELRTEKKYHEFIPLDYSEFCLRYPQFQHAFQEEEEATCQYTSPKIINPPETDQTILEFIDNQLYYDEFCDAVDNIKRVYFTPCVIDMKEINTLLNPFRYLRELLIYFHLLGYTITWGDCTWEYIEVPSINKKYNKGRWGFINLSRPIIIPDSIQRSYF